MQDKILGPLTMLQFVYAVVGFGTCYAIFMSAPKPLSYILAAPIAFFVLLLDFVKINERPFLDFFIAAIEYSATPKKRFWHQNTSSNMDVEVYHIQQSNQPTAKHKDISRTQMDAFAKKADTADQSLISK